MNNEIICVIPCREGSVRLPHKNKKELLGKPLWQWTVEQALAIKEFDTIYVTTDDHDIIEGCIPYEEQDIRFKVIVRPQYLATSDTPMWAVVEHCCQQHRDDAIIVLLQPTSPLRLESDIREALKAFELYDRKLGLFSLSWKYPDTILKLNGAIFIHYLGTIRNTKSFVHTTGIAYMMPPERSHDINYQQDFKLVEKELKRRKREYDKED